MSEMKSTCHLKFSPALRWWKGRGLSSQTERVWIHVDHWGVMWPESVIWPFWTSVSSSRSVLSETPYMNTWPRVRPWQVSIPFSCINIRIFNTVGSALTGWILMQIMSFKASGPEVTDWDILIFFSPWLLTCGDRSCVHYHLLIIII